MQPFECPICFAKRPSEVHLDWCDYNENDFDNTALYNERDDEDEPTR